MNGRTLLVLAAILAAAVAGCLEAEQPLEATDGSDPTANASEEPDEPGAANASDEGEQEAPEQEPSANRTTEDGGNETDAADDEGNRTADEQADDPEPADPGWPAPEEASIRPGIAVDADEIEIPENEGGNCTANFLFSGPLNRTLYLGTAGHCIGEDATEVELTANATHTAEVAWSQDNASMDFALLALDEDYREQVHPSVLHWGGPEDVAREATLGDPLVAYGSSPNRGGYDETSPMEGYLEQRCAERWFAQLPGYGPGDSGSPVLTADGEALGILVGGRAGVGTGCLPQANSARIVPIELALTAAEEGLGVDLSLVTWSQQRAGTFPALPSP